MMNYFWTDPQLIANNLFKFVDSFLSQIILHCKKKLVPWRFLFDKFSFFEEIIEFFTEFKQLNSH